MTGTCQQCGSFSGQYALCKDHRVARRHDDAATDGGPRPPVDTAHKCVACGTVYLYPKHDACPDCDSTRRRYAGPLDGPRLPATPSQLEVDQ